jgi:prophage maintenance system killer protein
MRMFPVCMRGEYIVAIKANKRKSKTFYYMHVSFRGVEFVLDKEKAHRNTKETAEFLANEYLRKRIEEVGFVLKEF